LRFLLPSAITIALTKTNERQGMVPGWEAFCLDPKFVSPAQTRAGFVLSSERERMERPHHLETASTSNSSKLTGIVIVVLIHLAAISALVATLASGQIMARIKEIQASVAAEKVPPKAPPPPPPDLAKPPPPVAIVPEFSVQQEAPPPITTVKAAPPAPPKSAAPPAAPTQLESIARTHTLPPYPTISQRLGEQGTTNMQVGIGTDGSVTDCKVTKSSGSQRLDDAACTYVKGHWRWKPPTREGQAVAVQTDVNVVWNLKDAQ
jgi:periplasmic protein TonB